MEIKKTKEAKKKKTSNKPMTEEEKLKYEVAKELGLIEKVLNFGWGGLTAKETGRIGGIITKKKRNAKNQDGGLTM